MAAANIPILLFEDLTGIEIAKNPKEPPRSEFGATSLSHDLLLLAGLEVIQFRRNQQVAYRVLEHSKGVIKAINALIKEIESPTEDQWDKFEQCHNGIDEVEELLFRLEDTSKDEAKRFVTVPKDVLGFFEEVEAWSTNRKILRDVARNLFSKPAITAVFQAPPEVISWKEREQQCQFQDDVAFFNELWGPIDRYSQQIIAAFTRPQKSTARTKEIAEIVRKIRNTIPGIRNSHLNVTRIYNSTWATFSVRYAFIIQGVMEIALDTITDRETALHFQSKLVWDEAWQLLQHLVSGREHFETYQTLAAHFEAFEAILKQHAIIDIPKAYLELMRLPNNTHRPYRARAVAIVSVCRTLVGQFKKLEAKQKAEMIESLENVLDEALYALTLATQELKWTNNYETDDDAVVAGFKTAQSALEASFSTFGISDQWNEAFARIDGAKTKDQNQAKLMNARFKEVCTRIGQMVNRITVNVNIQGGSQKITVQVEHTARLSVLLHTVEKYIDRSRVKSCAFQTKDGKPVSLNQSIAEYSGSTSGSCDITLIAK
ncbi:hypothetical protein DL96DRAFT_1585824 [Flagelloscypha sp. PMI_526]|nr:hypothetical protein DL96DRAFT_1585824 [Flagelloscypha sp. PMI_526]